MNNPFYPVAETPLEVVVPSDYDQSIQRVDSKKLIYNTNTGKPVSVVGTGYNLIPFKDVDDLICTRLGNAGVMYDPTHELDRGGRKLFSKYRLLDDEFKFTVGEKDTSQAVIYTINSYDSSTAFTASWGMFRMICSNGCIYGDTEFKSKVAHTREANYGQMINNLVNNLDSFKEVKRFYQALSEYELIEKTGNDIIDELVPDNRVTAIEERVKHYQNTHEFPEQELDHSAIFTGRLHEEYGNSIGIRRVESVKAHWNKPRHLVPDEEKPRNLWTLYNCFTNVITHEVDSANTRHNLHQKVTGQFKQLLEV